MTALKIAKFRWREYLGVCSILLNIRSVYRLRVCGSSKMYSKLTYFYYVILCNTMLLNFLFIMFLSYFVLLFSLIIRFLRRFFTTSKLSIMQFTNTVHSENFTRVYFRETSRRSFAKMKPSRNSKITPSFIDAGKSCPSREFLTLQICILKLFAKIKFSRKFLNLQ